MAIIDRVMNKTVTVIAQGQYWNQIGIIKDVSFDSQGQPVFTLLMPDENMITISRFDQRYNPNITW